jgi:hypothetical protein
MKREGIKIVSVKIVYINLSSGIQSLVVRQVYP